MQTSPSKYPCNLTIFTQNEPFTGFYQTSVTRILQNFYKFGDLKPATLFKRDSSASGSFHFLRIDINNFNFGGSITNAHDFLLDFLVSII